MALKHVKECSTSFIIREMQIIPSPRKYSSPITLANLQKFYIAHASSLYYSYINMGIPLLEICLTHVKKICMKLFITTMFVK